MNRQHPSASPKRMAIRLAWVLLVVVLLAGVTTGIVLLVPDGGAADTSQSPTFRSRRGALTISVSESGTVKNREQVVIKSEVEGRIAVLTLIPEGTHVEKGDLLIELDTSKLEESKVTQQITVLRSESTFINARENLAVVKNQAESDIARAELDLRFSKEDQIKYNEGEFPQQKRQAESKITIAKEELRRAEEKLEWSKILRKEKYISENELQADELAWKRYELDVSLSEGDLALLLDYTNQRRIAELDSNVIEANRALLRVRLRAAANVVQAEADLEAKEQEDIRQKNKLQKINDQIEKCKIYAPVGGLVVFATTGRGRYRSNEEPLEEGQEVRERQELLFLPTKNDMLAEIKIHESSLDKVEVGMPVRITVDAVPGKVYPGRVSKIGLLPDAQSAWLNPDLKLYTTEIYLECDASDLRAGMSCRAEVIVEQHEDAIYVPIQSVLRVGGQPTVYLPTAEDGEPEPRSVEIGLDNNRMVLIKSGLSEGEPVLLSPPLAPSVLSEKSRADKVNVARTERLETSSSGTEMGARNPAGGRRGGEDNPRRRGGNREHDGERSRGERRENSGRPSFGNKSPDEMRKRYESMSDEEKEALRKRMEQYRDGGGHGSEGTRPRRPDGK